MKVQIFAYSSEGLPILSYHFNGKGPLVLILGAVHGDEPEGHFIALALLKKWISNFPYRLSLTLVPCFNIEGTLLHTRTNFRKVDLNRNLPTKNWSHKYQKERYHPGSAPCSEEENQSLVQWIKTHKPQIIFTLHSWNPMINVNGNCQPEADILSRATGYKISDDIGYPTPGSLGDYCGVERGIPVITYEAERGGSIQEALNLHAPAIEKALFATEKRKAFLKN